MLEHLPRRCDEGFFFAGCRVLKDPSSKVERLRIPSGRESEPAIILAVCNTCDPGITSKSLQVGPVLGGLDARPQGLPLAMYWAYQDIPDNALVALSVVRRARWL
ncbi:hypothetical protein CDL15_Pgr020630 [Punica granatum]|uniref:Uncharacterized protein n=1 Tax=Punica granatum TaxID=22663 RepID=A0A218XPX2_PUNGR|nr:hypothetical protein CDL15_Pgr020630 [Punica granatum]